jgi:hypothetical protein
MFPESGMIDDSERSERGRTIGARQIALQDFLLRRVDGAEDGHVGRVGVSQMGRLPDGRLSYLLSFADEDGKEPGHGVLRWVRLGRLGRALRALHLSDDGIQDTRMLPFGVDLEGRVPLLAGFSFWRDGGGDHHLREIAVLPARDGYAVTFRDDSPGDDRFGAQIDLVLIPEANVISLHDRRFDEAVGSIDAPRELGQAALRGFSLRYPDSDHHVFQIQVGLSGDRLRLSMRDNDRNRRFAGTVEYALLTDR